MNTKTIKFDLNKYKLYEKIKAKQGDTKSRFLLFQLLDGSIPFNLKNRSVRAYMIKPDGREIFNDLIVNNYNLGYCTLELTNQVLAAQGIVKIELMVTEGDKKLTSSVFELEVVKSINSEKSIVSTNEFTALLNGLAALSEYDNYKNSVKEMEINKANKAEVEEKFISVEEKIKNNSEQLDNKANEADVKNKYYDVAKGLDTALALNEFRFRRVHARTLNKNLKYHMSSMDLSKNFIDLSDGNMYEELETSSTLTQTVANGKFNLSNNGDAGSQSRRLLGKFNLFSSYEISIANIVRQTTLGVRCGINIINKVDNDMYNIFVAFNSLNKLEVRSEMFLDGTSQGIIVNHSEENTKDNANVIFTVLRDRVDIYIVEDNIKRFLVTVNISKSLNTINLINRTTVALYTRLNQNESVTYTKFENYYDSGISQGDIKPIKYKNGSTLIKNGRIYFTVSSRFQVDSYQTIISQNIGGDDYKLEGVLLFVVNDKIGYDIASSILYDNDSGKFLIWNTSFNNNHILSYGEAYCDIMHGVNLIDMNLMPGGIINDTDFKAKVGDEDPDFFYNYETQKWNMIICRLTYVEEESKDIYRYFLFESDNPFTGYVFKDKTLTGANTGGSIVKVSDKYYLICGSNYHVKSQYNIYNLDDLSTFKSLLFDYGDGGYRGWGTVFTIPCGSYTKYGWITFDRESEGQTQWTYGNIYYYESDMLNKGCEYNIKYSY